MATPQYATEQLIANVKRRCAVPTSQLTYTPADFTAIANDELQGQVVPLIMSTREEYFVTHDDQQLENGELEIPSNAVGEKLRSTCLVVSTNPLILVNVPRIDLDVVAGVGYANYNVLCGLYIEGNKLKPYPPQSVTSNATFRFYYYKRTLVLADPSAYGQITAIDSGTNTITLSFVPYDWEAGTELNAVSQSSPFEITSSLITASAVSSPSVICDSVDGLSIGDYVSEYGYSAIPQVPVEAHAYLAQLTAVKALEGLGDRTGMEAALAEANILKKSLMVMISQRVDGSVKKVINPNGGLRMSAGVWRRGFGGGY